MICSRWNQIYKYDLALISIIINNNTIIFVMFFHKGTQIDLCDLWKRKAILINQRSVNTIGLFSFFEKHFYITWHFIHLSNAFVQSDSLCVCSTSIALVLYVIKDWEFIPPKRTAKELVLCYNGRLIWFINAAQESLTLWTLSSFLAIFCSFAFTVGSFFPAV